MRATLAGQLTAALAEHLFTPVDVRPAGEDAEWVTVLGLVRRGTVVETFPGLDSRSLVGDDMVHLVATDFPDATPGPGWWVREREGVNAGRVLRLTEPARPNRTGRVLVAPVALNAEAVPAGLPNLD